MGNSEIDGMPAREILSMLRRAVREDWPVSHEQKKRSAQIIAEIIENAEGQFSPKDIMTATRVQLDMANSNIKNALAVENAEFQREKFDVLSNLEKSISHSMADGPDIGPIVSDTPMAAIEFIDVTPAESDSEQPEN